MKTRYIHYFTWVIPFFLALQVNGTILADSIKSIPFLEDWNSAGFTANSWTFPWMQGNWTIQTTQGNPLPCAVFTGLPVQSNYIYSLRSPWFDATDLTCNDILLSFDLKLNDISASGTEKLRIEVEHDTVINQIFILNNTGSFTWKNYSLKISGVNGKLFRLRIISYGLVSDRIDQWMIDNISVTGKCKIPNNFAVYNFGYCSMPPYCLIKLFWNRPTCAEYGFLMNFIYDDGTAESGYRLEPNSVGWLGNEFPVSPSWTGVLNSFQVYFIEFGSGSNQQLSIDVFDGTQSLVGSSSLFSAVAGTWITVNVNNIPFNGLFYAMVKWDNTPANSFYLGYDTDGPFSTQDLEWYYNGSVFKKLTDTAVAGANPGVFLIRANALIQQKKKILLPGYSIPMDSSIILGYNIYRAPWFDSIFTKINASPVIDTSYTDTINNSPYECLAIYKITAVYSNNCESDPTDQYFGGCVTGINDQKNENTITISPNPASEFIEISSKSEMINLKILDLTGKMVLVRNPGKEKKYTINLKGLPDGIYLLSVETKTGITIKKISKIQY